jgi:CubicO group peptidase (beta-lactamase class C family)
MRPLLLTLTLVALLPCRGAAQAPFDDFDTYVTDAMALWKVPGLAVSIVKDDRIVFARGYGVRNLGSDALVDEHTIFAIGSSSKAFIRRSQSACW